MDDMQLSMQEIADLCRRLSPIKARRALATLLVALHQSGALDGRGVLAIVGRRRRPYRRPSFGDHLLGFEQMDMIGGGDDASSGTA